MNRIDKAWEEAMALADEAREEIRTDEEIEEDKRDEAEHQMVLEALSNQANRYKSLFEEFPSPEMAPYEIQKKIIAEMTRRNLRPYHL